MAFKSVSRLTPLFKNSFINCFCENDRRLSGLINISSSKSLHTFKPLFKKQEVSIVIDRGGKEIAAKGKEGDSILDVVVNNEIDLSGYGACEGTLSCSTCHVILSQEDFDKVPEKASDEELDMLDLAPDVCATSRLGCQVYLAKKIEGIKVKVPSVIKDMREFPGASSVKS